jgi:excisionase family DNA binding protein
MQEYLDRSPTSKALLNTPEAAAVLGCTPDTLVTWRCTKAVKIPFVRIGRLVRYRRTDLDAFLDQNSVKA